MRAAVAMLAMSLAMTTQATAQEAVVGYATCRDVAIERLERELRRHVEGAFAEQVPSVDMAGIAFCADIGIYMCNQKDASDACHGALTVAQQALKADVLSGLPAPQVVAGRRGLWSDALYPRMFDLAHGQSAGPDCAGVATGDGPRCKARAANRRLEIALRAWTLARYLGAAPGAVEAGWAGPPPPTRPRARE